MSITLTVVTSIIILAVLAGILAFLKTKKQKGGESSIKIIEEYSGLIVSLVEDATKILTIDKNISEDEFKEQVAKIVAESFYKEIQSEDDLKNTILSKLTEAEIENLLSILFNMQPKTFNLSTIYNKLIEQKMADEDAKDDTEPTT